MGVDYSFGVKNIEIPVPTFLKHNNSSVATLTLKFKRLFAIWIGTATYHSDRELRIPFGNINGKLRPVFHQKEANVV